jgi:dihydrofolate synthase/folylpolyglutamate synthase
LLDGAHNVAGAKALAAALKENFPSVKPALVFGILRDKDWQAICGILAPLTSHIFLVPVPSERSAAPRELAEICGRANPAAKVQEYVSLRAALPDAEKHALVVIAGSLYLIGEAIELLGLSQGKTEGERGLNEWKVYESFSSPESLR